MLIFIHFKWSLNQLSDIYRQFSSLHRALCDCYTWASLHLFAHKHVKVGGKAPWAVARNMSRHSSITQDWMGWNTGLFPQSLSSPLLGYLSLPRPPVTYPIPPKAELGLCYLITFMRSQDLPMVHFSRDSGKFCVQVIGMQNEMNRKRHLPIQTRLTRDTRQMTNSHRKNGSLEALCASLLRSWQVS